MEKKKTCKSNVNCCVYGCTSVYKKNPNLSFHTFPHPDKEKVNVVDTFNNVVECDRRKLWETRLKMGKKVTNSMRVCSLHFVENDYLTPACHSLRFLKNTAVPTQNLPQCPSSAENNQFKERQIRFNKLCEKRNKELSNVPEATVTAQEETQNKVVAEYEAAEGLLLLNPVKTVNDSATQVELHFKDVGVQVNTGDLITVFDVIKTDRELKILTGLPSLILLQALVKIFILIKPDVRNRVLDIKKRIVLTLMRIKLDLPYVALGVLFGVSSQTCKTIFYNTTLVLSNILQHGIPFPTREENMQNIPKCFSSFQKCRIILDCIEIFVQRSKKLCCRIKLYSHYKKSTTVKFLTGVNPAGLITYVSPAYGGRASDKKIFEQSGLFEKLDPYIDQIMVDKGFLIEDICNNVGIQIIRPPFLRKKKQFNKTEAQLNAKIASARVHIERTNARIKIFRLLKNTIPINLIPIIHDIMIIVCGLTNLSNPILSDQRFLQ